MHTLANLAKALNRPAVYLQGLMKRFDIPLPLKTNELTTSRTNDLPLLLFLQTVISLRTLNVSEETILELWRIERKLLQLLHADSTGSPTWFLDSCGSKSRRTHRLLLSNFDIGIYLAPGTIQLGLQFADSAKELFTGPEMGEDALALLQSYLAARACLQSSITAELPRLRAALHLANRLAT